MKLIYRIYQLFVVLPFLIFCSIACALVTTIGCTLGDGHYWGYYPGKWWARFIIWVSLLPVKVEGREHLRKDQSYVLSATTRDRLTSSSSTASWAATSSG